MREIKFRAWDKKTKLMLYHAETMYDTFCDGRDLLEKQYGEKEADEKYWDSSLAVSSFGELINNDNIILMQYTGLNDKNGKEIYEGDIVDDGWKDINGKKINKYHIVKFGEHDTCSGDYYSDGAYGFYLENNMEEEHSLPFHEPLEIIGNIHENPELLEGK